MANPNGSTISVDQILSTTLFAMLPDFADNIFNGTPALKALRKLGVDLDEDSGSKLTVPLEYAKSTALWVAEGDTVPISGTSIASMATYDWKLLYGSTAVSDFEAAVNTGERGIVKLVKVKVANVQKNMRDMVNVALFSSGAVTAQPAGLGAIASDVNPAAGNLGGIDRTAAGNSFWQGYHDTNGGASLAIADMATAFNSCSYGDTAPDVIFCTQTGSAAYEALLQGKQLVSNMGRGDAGFGDLFYKGAPVIWDRACTVKTMYFVTSSNLKLVTLADYGFKAIDPFRNPTITSTVHQVEFFGQILSTTPRTNGSLMRSNL